jgi:two-component system cell cycle sensor histidine kinase/response regulator CckA
MPAESSPRAVVHDLANVLAAIEGSSELLLARVESPPLRRLVEEIWVSARGAAAISRQLLDPEPSAGDACHIDEVIAQMDCLLRGLATARIEVVLDLGCPEVIVPVERGRLLRALVNLVVNAREAMLEGGRLRIETRATNAQRVTLAIADTGRGITESHRARLFDPTFSTKANGRGLGLATVHAIVTAAGGTVEVASPPGGGATFQIHLPAAPAGVGATPAPSRSIAPRAPLAVLLVDDDDEGRAVLRELLTAAAIDVSDTSDGQSALEAFCKTSTRPALAIIDLHLAEGAGSAVGEALRQRSPGLPLIYISGLRDDDKEVQAAIGDDPTIRFLGKPFAFQELLAEIRALTLPG